MAAMPPYAPVRPTPMTDATPSKYASMAAKSVVCASKSMLK